MTNKNTNNQVLRCLYDAKEMANATLERDLLEARTLGNVTLDDESLQYVVTLASRALDQAVNRTSDRIQNLLATTANG